jgi:hypothetical protein
LSWLNVGETVLGNIAGEDGGDGEEGVGNGEREWLREGEWSWEKWRRKWGKKAQPRGRGDQPPVMIEKGKRLRVRTMEMRGAGERWMSSGWKRET